MRMRWKLFMVVGAVLVIMSSLAMAQPVKEEPKTGPELKGPGQPEGLIPVLAWWLDLTKEQVEQMHAIVELARPEAKEAAVAIADAQQALHEAVTAGAGAEDIQAAAAALGVVIGNQAVLHAQTVASLKAVLTEEQLKDFEKIRTKLPQLAQLLPKRKLAKGDGEKSDKQPAGDKSGKTPTDKGDTGDKQPAEKVTMSPEAAFKAADANKDGVLSLKEFLAALATMKEGGETTKDGDQTPKDGEQIIKK